MKTKKIIIGILLALIISLLCYINFGLNKPEEEEVVIVEPETPEVKEVQPLRDLWLENKDINPDYQGEVIFDSGLVNKSFVQAKSVYKENGEPYHFYNQWGSVVSDVDSYTGNDVYIWQNWKDGSYDYNILGGSVFMDYRNSLDDQNIIIYGHHFSVGGGNDPMRIKAFTPLEKLLEEENYEDNKYVELVLDNETRRYEIAYVYVFDQTSDYDMENGQFFRINYDEDPSGNADPGYYQRYIDYCEEYSLYETGVELTTNDKTLTLQTCIGGTDLEKQILVCKEIEVKKY